MRMPARRAAWLWRLALVGLVVAFAAPGAGGDSGLALPLLVSSVLVLTLVVALAALFPHLPAVASSGQAPDRLLEADHPVRQRDPDAAGHTRPRAPGQTASGRH